jgi:hypothetical protein
MSIQLGTEIHNEMEADFRARGQAHQEKIQFIKDAKEVRRVKRNAARDLLITSLTEQDWKLIRTTCLDALPDEGVLSMEPQYDELRYVLAILIGIVDLQS